ncbi:MAG: acyl-ACP--UDP-N-acetylglucosamine O-acyltransferase [Salinivirgaceae bacterium]|jgi:UDP-N-acetylglucosamine acyltransferase|nr:acyl-ACP--UDP-N-acetylglucosamine O-acyltransferase [Salinivirgaceae bacterium]
MEYRLANVHPEAKIGKDVIIEPFVTIEKDVEIGDGCWIGANAVIKNFTKIGKHCKIFHGAVVGAIPQDLKFKGEETFVHIGDNTTIRECVTVNRGTAARGGTTVGSNCLLMAYSHIAHDCILGNGIIIGNATQLAGEVEIDDNAILSGGILVHQFVRIGAHVIIQGGSKVGKDVPPYVTAGRDPFSYCGLNSIGLRRRAFSTDQVNIIQGTFRFLYQNGLNTSQAVELIEKEVEESKERNEILEFVKGSKRGIIPGII